MRNLKWVEWLVFFLVTTIYYGLYGVNLYGLKWLWFVFAAVGTMMLGLDKYKHMGLMKNV